MLPDDAVLILVWTVVRYVLMIGSCRPRMQRTARCLEHLGCRWVGSVDQWMQDAWTCCLSVTGFCRSRDGRRGTMLRTFGLNATTVMTGCLGATWNPFVSAFPLQMFPVVRTLSVTSLCNYLSWNCMRVKVCECEPARVFVSSRSPALNRASTVSFWSETCMLTCSHCSRAGGLLCPRVHTAGEMVPWLVEDWTVCLRSFENKCLMSRVQTQHLCNSKGNLGTWLFGSEWSTLVCSGVNAHTTITN